jgi:N-dimethylarginine dimethylaminohydrolase
MTSKQESLPAPGMEPPRNKKIEASIESWLETRSDARRQSNKAKAKHDALMQLMVDEGFELYPFIDQDTKKKCVVKADARVRARVRRTIRR